MFIRGWHAMSHTKSDDRGATTAHPALPPTRSVSALESFRAMQAELADRTAELSEGLPIEGFLATSLAEHAAMISTRLEQIARTERAARSPLVERGLLARVTQRRAVAKRLITQLHADPAAHARDLRAIPEGIDHLIDQWDRLHRATTDAEAPAWGPDHLQLAEALLGRRPGERPVTDFARYTEVYDGHPSPLVPAAELAGKSPGRRQKHALARLAGFITAQLADLAAERDAMCGGRAEREAIELAEWARFAEIKTREGMIREKKEAIREFGQAMRMLGEACELVLAQSPDAPPPGKRDPRKTALRKIIKRVIAEHPAQIELRA